MLHAILAGVAVGSDAEARRFVGPGTEVLSLGGRAVLGWPERRRP